MKFTQVISFRQTSAHPQPQEQQEDSMPSSLVPFRQRYGMSLLALLGLLALLSLSLIPLAGYLMQPSENKTVAEAPSPALEETLLERVRDELRNQPFTSFKDLSSLPREDGSIEVPSTLFPSTQESLKEVNAGSFDLYRLRVLLLSSPGEGNEIRLRATVSRQDASGEHFQNSEFTVNPPR